MKMKHANYARTRATIAKDGQTTFNSVGPDRATEFHKPIKPFFKMKGFIISLEVAIALFFIIIAVITVCSMSSKDDRVIDRIMQAYTALFILVSGAVIILCVHMAAGLI